MNCLVLGGAGFLGSYLVPCLLQEGCAVHVFDRSWTGPEGLHPRLPLRGVRASLHDEARLAQALRGQDIVFHLAGKASPQAAEDDPHADYASHVLPTIRLLELARQAGVRRVIYFSSGGTVYGRPERLPIAEEQPTRPIGALGVRNCTIEQYLHAFHAAKGLDYVVLRVANPYGERQRADRGQGAVAVFAERLLRGEEICLWGHSRTQRDFLHAEDVAEAAVRAARYQGPERIFNVGSGTGVTLHALIEQLALLTGCPARVRVLPARGFDVPANVLDISRARRCLGWSPRVSWPSGLSRVVASLRKQQPASMVIAARLSCCLPEPAAGKDEAARATQLARS